MNVPRKSKAIRITLASLAGNAARQSAPILNPTGAESALIGIRVHRGAATLPVQAALEVYLVRGDDATRGDAATLVEHAQLLGLLLPSSKDSAILAGDFDTGPLGPLGPRWGILIQSKLRHPLPEGIRAHRVRYFFL